MTTPGRPPLLANRWAAAGVSVSFLLAGFLFTVVLYSVLAGQFFGQTAPGLTAATLLQAGSALAVFGALTWLMGLRTIRLTPEDLRWRPGGVPGAVAGLAWGLAPAVAALVLAVPVAGAGWSADGGTGLQWLASLWQLLGVLGPAALAEEVIFRGLPLVLLAAAFGRTPAVVGLAVLFGAAHLLNPGITALGVVNISLAGVFLGLVFYLPGGLWTATGAHIGWNLTLAALAAPVSGLPLPVPAIDYHPGGPVWLTGGGFGPEGGLITTLVLLIAIGLVARKLP